MKTKQFLKSLYLTIVSSWLVCGKSDSEEKSIRVVYNYWTEKQDYDTLSSLKISNTFNFISQKTSFFHIGTFGFSSHKFV